VENVELTYTGVERALEKLEAHLASNGALHKIMKDRQKNEGQTK
jgi:hypothetical protein